MKKERKERKRYSRKVIGNAFYAQQSMVADPRRDHTDINADIPMPIRRYEDVKIQRRRDVYADADVYALVLVIGSGVGTRIVLVLKVRYTLVKTNAQISSYEINLSLPASFLEKQFSRIDRLKNKDKIKERLWLKLTATQ